MADGARPMRSSPSRRSTSAGAKRLARRLVSRHACRDASGEHRPTGTCRPPGVRGPGAHASASAELYEARLARARERTKAPGTGRPHRLCRPRAQRQPRVPDGLRSSLRGGRPRRRARPASRPSSSATSATGMAGAAPLHDAPAPLPGPQPHRPAARSVAAAGGDPRARRASSGGARVGVAGWKTYARRDWLEAPAFLVDTLRDAGGRGGLVRERVRPLHRRRGSACARATRSISSSPSSTPACHTSEGVKRLLRGLRPGLTEQQCVRAAGLERHAALVPPHAHGRTARRARAAQPERPCHRAGRPVHDGLRRLGRAHLPRRLRRRRRRASSRQASATTSGASWLPTSRPSPSGTWPCGSARRAERSRRSSIATWATPSSASSSNPGHLLHLDEWVASPISAGLRRRAALRHGDAG